jgi:hypothetical protein
VISSAAVHTPGEVSTPGAATLPHTILQGCAITPRTPLDRPRYADGPFLELRRGGADPSAQVQPGVPRAEIQPGWASAQMQPGGPAAPARVQTAPSTAGKALVAPHARLPATNGAAAHKRPAVLNNKAEHAAQALAAVNAASHRHPVLGKAQLTALVDRLHAPRRKQDPQLPPSQASGGWQRHSAAAVATRLGGGAATGSGPDEGASAMRRRGSRAKNSPGRIRQIQPRSDKISPPERGENSPAGGSSTAPLAEGALQVQLLAGGGGESGSLGEPAPASQLVAGEKQERQRGAVWGAELEGEGEEEGQARDVGGESLYADVAALSTGGNAFINAFIPDRAALYAVGEALTVDVDAPELDGVKWAIGLGPSVAKVDWGGGLSRRVEGQARPQAEDAAAVGAGSAASASAVARSDREHSPVPSALHAPSHESHNKKTSAIPQQKAPATFPRQAPASTQKDNPVSPSTKAPAGPPQPIPAGLYQKPPAASKKNHPTQPKHATPRAPVGTSCRGTEDVAGGGECVEHTVGRGVHAECIAGGRRRARNTAGEGPRADRSRRVDASPSGAETEPAGVHATGGQGLMPSGESRGPSRLVPAESRAKSAVGRPPLAIHQETEAERALAVAAGAVRRRPQHKLKPAQSRDSHRSAAEPEPACAAGGGECTGGGAKGAKGEGCGAKRRGVEEEEIQVESGRTGGAADRGVPSGAPAAAGDGNGVPSPSAAWAPLRLGATVEALAASSAVFGLCRQLLHLQPPPPVFSPTQPPPVFSRTDQSGTHDRNDAQATRAAQIHASPTHAAHTCTAPGALSERRHSPPQQRPTRGTCAPHDTKNSLDAPNSSPGEASMRGGGGGYSYHLLRVMQLRRHVSPALLQQALEAAEEAADGKAGGVGSEEAGATAGVGRGGRGMGAGAEAWNAMASAGAGLGKNAGGASSECSRGTQPSPHPPAASPCLVFACGPLESLGRFIRSPLWPQPVPSPNDQAPPHARSILFSDTLIHTPPALHTPLEAEGTIALCVWRTVLAMTWDAAGAPDGSACSDGGGGGAGLRSDGGGASREGVGASSGGELGGRSGGSRRGVAAPTDSVGGISSCSRAHGPASRPVPAGIAPSVAAICSGGAVPLFVLDYVVSADGANLL